MQAVAKSSGPVELVALAAYSLSAFACLKVSLRLPWGEASEVLLSLSLYRAPEEKATPVDQLSEETCNLRMRSSVSLLRVCRRLGEGDLAILLPHLLPRITPLLNNSLDLRHEERLQLLEAAAHGSNHFSSLADQSLYLESLLHGTLNMLAEFRAAGVLEELSKFNALSMDVHARERLSEVVHTCEVASHAVRTSALNRKVFPAVLEPMVLLMRTIHELNPPPTARELVVILNLETAPGSKDAMDRLQQMGVALGDEANIARQHFVGKLRDSTYEVIANACSKNLSDSLLVQEMVFSSVLESVAVLEPVSIYSFVRVVVRLVLHTCGSTFCASLVNTVTRIQARIVDGIARLNSIESTSESIALDHAWRLVQRACVDAVREPALRAAGRLEEGLEDNFPEEFRALLLQSMSSFDSHASESSAQTVLKGMAVFQPAPVLQACMQALCKASLHSVHESVITVLLAAISSSPQQSASWLVSASNVSAQSVEELVSRISSSGKKSGRNALKTFIREKLGIAFGVPEGSAKVRAVLDLDHPLIIPGKSQGQFKDPAAARQRTEALHAQVPIDLAHAFDEPDKS
uniref:Uncharacterized protein n=4 Tax=Rhodosorus marinus TaxID=101924 RepID=A0A7S2ZHB3_9RHOD|mmetsp:Transcript_18300/g.73352  ORF Transcript_18300/g.73352 Transcript_18300/m.73352 type:complete len:578 (+) Transcript_18300:1948-3681(+)